MFSDTHDQVGQSVMNVWTLRPLVLQTRNGAQILSLIGFVVFSSVVMSQTKMFSVNI